MAFTSFALNDGWKFQRNPSANAVQPDCDDALWRTVKLPHDWCVDESFTPDACGGARNAWLPQGIACYRLHVTPSVFVKSEVVDETGQRIFNADFPVTFTVLGAGTLEALDNGLQTSLESFRGTNVRHTCAGRCMAIVRAGKQDGKITVRAAVPGLSDAILEIEVQ